VLILRIEIRACTLFLVDGEDLLIPILMISWPESATFITLSGDEEWDAEPGVHDLGKIFTSRHEALLGTPFNSAA